MLYRISLHVRIVFFWFLFCYLQINITCALAQEPAGKIISLQGSVDIFTSAQSKWLSASTDQELFAGDIIRTGDNGKAAILMADETMFQLNRNTLFQLKQVDNNAGWLKISTPPSNKGSHYWLEKGRLWFRNKNKNSVIDINTPNLVAAIRGTEFDLLVENDNTVRLTMLEGLVQGRNEFGTVVAGSKDQIIAKPGNSPVKQVLVNPENAVQWTLHLPDLINIKNLVFPALASNELQKKLTDSVQNLSQSRIPEAQEKLNKLAVETPDISLVHSLLALTYILTNQPQLGLISADRAVALTSQSPFALIIKSYAHQALFELDLALHSVDQALLVKPDNITALLIRARLLFGSDKIAEAEVTIDKAAQLATANSQILSLQGFLRLTDNNTSRALTLFKKASSCSPFSAEPHMGMALVNMRLGKQEEALREISIASLLEPQRSLYVSYWAKMLYQFGRRQKALQMMERARQLDPRDPTPDLYEALIKNDLNQPVQALTSLSNAAAKNDNRAVYRSRFLLDQDKAIVNVNQSVIYSALGLDAWAFHRAMTSVKTDQANSAAHLFLAGTLQAMDDFTLPFTSEFMLARLLMPANANSFNTFNKYTTFFDKPYLTTTISGATGSHDAGQGNINLSGALPAANLAFGITGSVSETDGWQKTIHERHEEGAAILKWEPTAASSLLFAAGTTEIERDDLLADNFSYDRTADPDNWQNDRVSDFEIGLHQRLAPATDLLMFFAYKKNKTWYQEHENVDPPAGWPISAISFFSDNKFSDSFYQGQAQLQHHTTNHQLTAGAMHLWAEGDYNVVTEDTYHYIWQNGNIWTFEFPYNFSLNKKFTSSYLQDRWHHSSWLTTETAVYLERMESNIEYYGTDWILDEVNPRFGIILTPDASNTIRLAWARYLHPFSCWRIDQMDIAGIPLYRTSPPGTLTTEYGATWEHEWQRAFLSVYFFNQKSDLDFLIPAPSKAKGTYSQTTRQKGAEVKLNLLLGRFTGFAASCKISDMTIENMTNLAYSPLESTDHTFITISTSLNWINPSGFSARISQTYRDQNFKDNSKPNDSFWLTDISLTYELPDKFGMISLDALNVFDNRFSWFSERNTLTGRNPAQEFMLRVSFNF